MHPDPNCQQYDYPATDSSETRYPIASVLDSVREEMRRLDELQSLLKSAELNWTEEQASRQKSDDALRKKRRLLIRRMMCYRRLRHRRFASRNNTKPTRSRNRNNAKNRCKPNWNLSVPKSRKVARRSSPSASRTSNCKISYPSSRNAGIDSGLQTAGRGRVSS